jgi:hypothetical protein
MAHEELRLPPTSRELLRADAQPYFAWPIDVSLRQFEQHLGGRNLERRAYWLGALLREANTRYPGVGRIDFDSDRLELDVVHEALADLDAAEESLCACKPKRTSSGPPPRNRGLLGNGSLLASNKDTCS